MDNNKTIAQLDRMHYAILAIAPGHHVLRTKHGPKVEFDTVVGETYYVMGGDKVIFPVCVTTIKKLSKDEADRLIANMKPQQAK